MEISTSHGIIYISHKGNCFQLDSPEKLVLLRTFVVDPVKLELPVHMKFFPKHNNKNKSEREVLTEILREPVQLQKAIAKFDAQSGSNDGNNMEV